MKFHYQEEIGNENEANVLCKFIHVWIYHATNGSSSSTTAKWSLEQTCTHENNLDMNAHGRDVPPEFSLISILIP